MSVIAGGSRIITENFSLFHLHKPSNYHGYNILTAQALLDIAKLTNYEFYILLQETFPGMKLVFHEIDSFLVLIPDPDKKFITNLSQIKTQLDLSECNYMEKELPDPNRGKCGTWKVSHCNLLEVVSLRPKTCSLLHYCQSCKECRVTPNCHHCTQETKASGIPVASRDVLTHELYKQALTEEANQGHEKLLTH